MKRAVSAFILAWLTIFLPAQVKSNDFKRETVYQIITDRFHNGSVTNDNPAQSSGLFDSTQSNWRLYWGGDLAGIQAKMT